MKKIKLFSTALVLMAVVGAAAPASAASEIAEGGLSGKSDTKVVIENIKEPGEDYNTLQLKAVPTMFNYGTHEVSADTITATATSTPTEGKVIEGDVRVMDTRFTKGEENAPIDTVLADRDWELSANYTQDQVKAANTLVSLKLTMGAAKYGGVTGSEATLTDGDAVPVVTVSDGSVGTYVFDKLTSTMVIADTNAGTYTGTINFTLSDTI